MSRISIQGTTVAYPLFSAEHLSLKSSLFSIFELQRRSSPRYLKAIDNVSIEIEPGDRVCLIGLNGSGKTTLLRTICGILPPAEGRIVIDGEVSPLLDFATGFEMEMTGYENIIARGLFLRHSVAEMREKQQAICEFSELGEFIHQPVKTYSSGMFLRLAFAIATSIEPDILVVDEIVGAGDQSFAHKAERRMLDMLGRGNVVVMATHSIELALRLCNKGVWLDRGRVREFGATKDVVSAYVKAYS